MNKIKELLEKKGMTQRELADRVGVTEVSMSRYINGDRTPKGPIAAMMARVLDADITDVIDIDFGDDQIMAMPDDYAPKFNMTNVFKSEANEVYVAVGRRPNGEPFFWHYDTPHTIGFNICSLLKSFPDADIVIRKATAGERARYENGE